MLRAELRVIEGKHQGKSLPLNVKQFLVGREADCHLRPNSDMVSRHHCVFIVDDYTVRVRDLGSTNGTFVNGERIQGQVVLNEGDRVDIGKLAFQLAIRKLVPVPAAAPVEPEYQEPEPQYEEEVYQEEASAGSQTMSFDSGEIPVYEDDQRQIAESDTTFHSAPPARQAPPPKRRAPILPAVFLPPPEETGAKAPEPKPAPAAPVEGAAPAPVNPSMAAADIIKSRMARRPPPGGK